jgi:hypothetical protein
MFRRFGLSWPRRLAIGLLVAAPLLFFLPGAVLADEDDDDGGYSQGGSGEEDDDREWEDRGDRHVQNYVYVLNQRDESVRVRSRVDLNVLRRGGEGVTPENVGCASSGGLDACWPTCDFLPVQGCIDGEAPVAEERTTIAVALQLNLYEGTYKGGGPFNFAFAKNETCTGCFAYAEAVQSTFAVDFRNVDWHDVDKRLKRLERDLERIERDLQRGRISFEQAKAQIGGVVDRFCGLAIDLGGGCEPPAAS